MAIFNSYVSLPEGSTNGSCILKLARNNQMLTDSADQDWPRKSTITDLTISHLDNRFTEKSGQSDMWFTMFRRFHTAVLHSCFLIFSHDLRNFPTRYRDGGTPPIHAFFGIFHSKPSSYWGTSMTGTKPPRLRRRLPCLRAPRLSPPVPLFQGHRASAASGSCASAKRRRPTITRRLRLGCWWRRRQTNWLVVSTRKIWVRQIGSSSQLGKIKVHGSKPPTSR